MLTDLLLFLFKDFLQVLLVLLLFPSDQFSQFFELLANQLLMDLISLFNPRLIALANGQILIDVFHASSSLSFEILVEPCNSRERIADRADIVVLLLLHMLVHALHAHHGCFLLAVKHQRLLMHVALHLCLFLALPTTVIVPGRIVTSLAVSVVDIGRLPLGVDVIPTLSVGHLAQLALT